MYFAVFEMMKCWIFEIFKILCLNPLSTNALLYKSLDLLNVASSADKVLILLDLLPGRFLITFGGCLERMLIYNDYYQVHYKVGIY